MADQRSCRRRKGSLKLSRSGTFEKAKIRGTQAKPFARRLHACTREKQRFHDTCTVHAHAVSRSSRSSSSESMHVSPEQRWNSSHRPLSGRRLHVGNRSDKARSGETWSNIETIVISTSLLVFIYRDACDCYTRYTRHPYSGDPSPT
jgi:hypothetical protein